MEAKQNTLTEPFNLRSTICDFSILRPSRQDFYQDISVLFQVNEQGMRSTEHTGIQALSLHQAEQQPFYLVYLLGYHVRLYLKRVLYYRNKLMFENYQPRNGALENTSKANIQAHKPSSFYCCFLECSFRLTGYTSEEKTLSASDSTPSRQAVIITGCGALVK